jgi:signal transduction histidine kinase/ligand-binding sensor domain-containing protein/DNA-binding response OmpR family regulator
MKLFPDVDISQRSICTIDLKGILLLLLIFMTQISKAQSNNYNFISFTSKDGLSSNTINTIVKDKYGYMWFGTDDGLNKFDGENFIVYRHSPDDTTTVDANRITALCEDRTGNLWVGTHESLCYYDRKKNAFTSFRRFRTDVVRALFIDHLDNLWIGSFEGLFMMNIRTGKTVHYEAQPARPDQLISNTIVSLFEDSQHRLWVGTNEGLHLYLRDKNCFQRFVHSNNDPLSISDNIIRAITEDSRQNLWFGTNDGGICQLLSDSYKFKSYRCNPKDAKTLSSDRVYTIVPDYAGKLWIGTEEGLNIFDPASSTTLRIVNDQRNKYRLIDKSIRSICIDKNNIYWIGTFQGGISKYDMNLAFFNLKQSNPFDQYGLSAPKVTSFVEDPQGDIYVGTDGGGLNHYHRKTGLFSHPKLVADNTNKTLTILAMERLGNELWIGTYGRGLYTLNMKTGAVRNYRKGNGPKDLLGNDVFCLKKDRDGNMWVGTNGDGVNVFNPVTGVFSRFEKKITAQDNLALNGFIRAIEEDLAGNIWIGTNGSGISVYNPFNKTFKVLDRTNSHLPSNQVSSIHISQIGTIWVGTFGGGLSKFGNNGKFITYDEKYGLSNTVIYKILESDSDKLWVSHNKGISCLDEQSGKFKNYSYQNGLQKSTYFLGAGLRTSSGELFFGGLDGFNYFNPRTLKSNTVVSPIVFTDLKISNRSVIPGPDEAIKEHISETKEITLDYRQNFSLEFTALNYTSPQDTRYSYKLEGFDKDWNHVGSSHKAVYTNLDPGHYIFLVKAETDNGLLIGREATIKIHVKPPFWMTTYAYILYFLLAASVLLVLRYSAIRRIKRKFALEQERIQVKQMIEQERKEAERQHEFDELRIKFLTNLSHEFRTPLSLIVGPVEKLLREEESQEKQEELSMVKRNAARLLNLVNQLLDFRRMQDNELKLNLKEGDLVSFIKDISASFKNIAETRQIDLVFSSSVSRYYTRFDHDKIERILLNLLSNAFKFTGKGGRVSVGIEQQLNSLLKIIVSDTGIGMEPCIQSKIFDRFFKGNTNGNVFNQGSGIGLSIAREFVKLHSGTITVETVLGKGSVFCILLPLEPIVEAAQDSDSTVELSANSLSHAKPKQGNTVPGLDKLTVLLVEDDDDFKYYLRQNLKSLYRIVEAADGNEGWQKALFIHPQVIVSDINMPGMDGITLSRKIKSDKRTCHIPFILLTALTGDAYQLRGLETGASDYLTKPFDFEILNIKIKNLLELNQNLKTTYSRQLTVIPSETQLQSDDEKLLARIIQYIESNLDSQNLSVEELSKHVYISRSSLYNKVVSLTGETPVELIRSVKLKKAALLLEKSDMKIAQVGYATGFASPNYFTRAFKEKFNVSPSEYQKTKTGSKNSDGPSPNS